MKTTFHLLPFKPEKFLNITGCLERNFKDFAFELSFLDPKDLIKFFYKENKIYKRSFGLWEKTCFEIFLKNTKSNEYIEFNFSADLEWSCFHFDSYKEGMKDYQKVKIKEIIFEPTNKKFKANWEFDTLDWDLVCGISSIIQTKDLKKSFWALNHANLTPDFHDFKSFILQSPRLP